MSSPKSRVHNTRSSNQQSPHSTRLTVKNDSVVTRSYPKKHVPISTKSPTQTIRSSGKSPYKNTSSKSSPQSNLNTVSKNPTVRNIRGKTSLDDELEKEDEKPTLCSQQKYAKGQMTVSKREHGLSEEKKSESKSEKFSTERATRGQRNKPISDKDVVSIIADGKGDNSSHQQTTGFSLEGVKDRGIKRSFADMEKQSKSIGITEGKELKNNKRSRIDSSTKEFGKKVDGRKIEDSKDSKVQAHDQKHDTADKGSSSDIETFSPRRSSRSVVPNRKFKDMEVEYTPTKRGDTQDGSNNKKLSQEKDKKNNTSVVKSGVKKSSVNLSRISKKPQVIKEKPKKAVPEIVEVIDSSTIVTSSQSGKRIQEEVANIDSDVDMEQTKENSDELSKNVTNEEKGNESVKRSIQDIGKQVDADKMGDIDDSYHSNTDDTISAVVQSSNYEDQDVDERGIGLIDPVTGLIIESQDKDTEKVKEPSSDLLDTAVKLVDQDNKPLDQLTSRGDNQNINLSVQQAKGLDDNSKCEDNVLGSITVMGSGDHRSPIVTSSDLQIENVPIVEVTLSETGNSTSDMALIESIGEIVETIESSYSAASACDKTKLVNTTTEDDDLTCHEKLNLDESVSTSSVKIPEEIGREVEKLIQISENLEKGQESIRNKDNKNIFVKRLPLSGNIPAMPGRIQTATIIKNPNAVQTVKEIPIQSSEGKNKIILLSGHKDVIEGISTTVDGKEEIICTPVSSSQESVTQNSGKAGSDTEELNNENVTIAESASALEVIKESTSESEMTKSRMSTASTQTPLISQRVASEAGQKSAGPVIKTITVNVQQPTDDEEGLNKGSEGNEGKQEYVIVHLPEGAEVKRFAVKEEKEQEVPYKETSDGTLICCLCSYTTQRKANWYKHRKKHLTGIPIKHHKCPKCSYRAATSSNLKRHIAIHDDVREFQCQFCSLTFRQKIHLERHVKYRHEEKSVKCPLCDYMCANENPDLKIHIKRRHLPNDGSDGTIKAYTCDQCGLVAISMKDLKQHMKFHKKGPELKLFCQHCSFVTDCESRLKRHILIHTKERPFQCGMCDYRGSQKEHVLRHMRSQHQIEIHRRQRKAFDNTSVEDDSDSNLEAEKKIDHADYSSQEKIFACNHCSMKFAKLINLYKHLHAQHREILPDEKDDEHLCVVCDFRTSTKKNLLVHMRKHNLLDQNPPSHVYSCVLCKYMNPKRRNLFQHMKKKHGIEIVMKDDGSTSCFVTDNTPVIMGRDESVSNILTVGDIVTATTEDTPLQIVTEDGVDKDSVQVQNVITFEDLAYAISHPQPTNGNVVIVEESPDDDSARIEGVTEHEAAEAIEGLQALAEQPGIIEGQEVITYDAQQLIIDEACQEEEKVQSDTVLETEVVTMEMEDSNIEMDDKSDADVSNIQLSQEQLASLSTGDYVEINGEMYKVEISTEENSITIGSE